MSDSLAQGDMEHYVAGLLRDRPEYVAMTGRCDHNFPTRDGRCIGCQRYTDVPLDLVITIEAHLLAQAFKYREGHTEACPAYHRLNSSLVPCNCGGQDWWRAARKAYEQQPERANQ